MRRQTFNYHVINFQGENFFLKNVPSCKLLDWKFNFEQICNNNYGLKMSRFRDMGSQTFKYDVINFQAKQFFVKNLPSCVLLDRKFNFELFQNKNQGLKIFYFRDMECKIGHICVTFSPERGFVPFLQTSISIFKGAQLSGQRLALGNQRFPVRVRLLTMCRGELPAAIARLMSNCL